jgi:uncharacterized RDD family membrane protein YckC
VLSMLLFPAGALVGDAAAEGCSLSVHLGGGGFAAYAASPSSTTSSSGAAPSASSSWAYACAARAADGPARGQAVVRSLLRLVGVLPVLSLVGYLVLMATGPERRQRIGDLLAPTVVVARQA